MFDKDRVKIIISSNAPSDEALKNFQKKLYNLQKSNNLNRMIRPLPDSQAVEPQ